MEKKLSLCTYNNCYTIPKINLLNGNQRVNITCNEHEGNSNQHTYEISKYLSKTEKRSKLTCSDCFKLFEDNQFFFYSNKLKKFLCSTCYNKIISTNNDFVKRNYSNFWNKCILHNLSFIKYCKTCGISLCEICEKNPHNNHIIEEINQKSENDVEEFKKNLEKQENMFETVKNIMIDCLNEMEKEFELKRLILNNYMNNNKNGNSIENLNEIYSDISQSFLNTLNDQNISFEDKLLFPYYFFKNLRKNNKNNNCSNNKANNNNDNDDKQSNNLNNNDNHNYVNDQLYNKVRRHENIPKDLVNIINVEGDGNCFYRVISYFLYKNEINHLNIRQEIFERAKKLHNNNHEKIDLLENYDLSMSNYIFNKMQNEGNFAGDYEISIAHQLYNINIAVYRPEIDSNQLSFIKFYNDDNKYDRDLLIMIYINNNHYQIAYYKKNKNNIDNKDNKNNLTIKENGKIGILKLKRDLEIKNENNKTPTENKTITNNTPKINFHYKTEENIKIFKIEEKNVIICMTRLSSSNLAIGLSNGIIKIYDVKIICQQSNGLGNTKERETLLIIDAFKGKRISYLYELKDKTLLCATFSKIHHIKLIKGDTDYEHIGSIKLSSKELPKKIIELGNELIVSLGEKTFKHENLSRKKCLIKVFNKINTSVNSKKESEENSFCLFSDNESINSCKSGQSVEWQSVYSSNEEDSLLITNKKNLKEDLRIRLYKNNENKDDIYICSIFPIDSPGKENKEGTYEFMATSNKNFYQGENCIQIFGIIKNPNRHGFIFFIKDTLNDLPCSRMNDSIIRINDKYIGIALQKYNEEGSNGIAIFDVNSKRVVNIIKGMSIGLLNKSIINNKFIFFTSNQTREVKKCNEIRLYKVNNRINNDLKDFLSKEKEKIIFGLSSGFTCMVELTPNIGKKRDNKIVYYSVSNDKSLFIILLEGNI